MLTKSTCLEQFVNMITIHSYRPGIIGDVVKLHAEYYAKHWEFDWRFETEVAGQLSEFIAEFDPASDGFWWAARDGDFAGAVAVDGSRSGPGKARVRWFIVPESMQGEGVGARLFNEAMAFCRERRFDAVYLWTFAGLNAARALYDRYGFMLTDEEVNAAWGSEITAQRFECHPTDSL